MHTDNDRQCRFFFLLQECTWIWILFLLFLRSLDQFRCILLCGEYRIRTRRHIWGSCTRTLVKRTQHSARMCGLDEVFNDFRWARNRQICAFPHSHYGASARKSNSDEKYQVVRILHIVRFARMLQFDVVADQSCRTHNRSLSPARLTRSVCEHALFMSSQMIPMNCAHVRRWWLDVYLILSSVFSLCFGTMKMYTTNNWKSKLDNAFTYIWVCSCVRLLMATYFGGKAVWMKPNTVLL